MMRSMWLVLVLAFAMVAQAGAIQLEVRRRMWKCILDDIDKDSVVVGDYQLVSAQGEPLTEGSISVNVKDPNNAAVFDKAGLAYGHFYFTAGMTGDYQTCFWSNDQDVYVNLDIKTGLGSVDYKELAKKEHLSGVQVELKKLEDTLRTIKLDMEHLRDREARMRDTSESTNSKAAWLSIMTLTTCVVLSAWQMMYLTKFFQKKKLI